ncbi:MAG: orotidine 5'-phosphate decarboxylase, partial [Actinomycetaceae bacterium]|nr:orotidine 5'-phosphate decarboxylase [Actinomycetaceae bacterium]
IGDAAQRLGIELSTFPGIFLAPGVGAQGAGPRELDAVFGDARSRVLASASRSILAGGPHVTGLCESFEQTLAQITQS